MMNFFEMIGGLAIDWWERPKREAELQRLREEVAKMDNQTRQHRANAAYRKACNEAMKQPRP